MKPQDHFSYCDGQDVISCWKDFVAQEGRFLPIGGETCEDNPPRTSCDNAQIELAQLHWSFINNGYRPEVLQRWTEGGCMETIRRRLGYRLVVKRATMPRTVRAGEPIPVELTLQNEGYAAMFNPRQALLVLSNQDHRYDLPVPDVDPRLWEPGLEQTAILSADLPPSVVDGACVLSLWLPDESATIQQDPRYAVRLKRIL